MYPNLRDSWRLIGALACAAALAGGAGCGQTDEEHVREVTEDYIGAIANRDFAGACGLFTAAYRAELGGEAGCAQAQEDQFGGAPGSTAELEIASVRVNGDRANVALNVSRGSGSPSPLALLMVNQGDDDWRIRGQQ
jgi:ketosteroid isomerase-like protein